MEISAKHFDKICRACLFQSDNMKSLFTKVSFDTQRSLSDILAFTTDINIKFEDNLPKQVCEECITVMYKADTFKRRCLESETILNNLAENPSHSFDLGFIKKSSSLIDDTDDFKEKFTELKSQSPPHSSSTPFLDRFETKQVTESSFALVDQTELTIEVPNSSKVVKQELPITFEHPEDFSDHFADDSEFESLPIELKQETIKKESKSYTCECGTIFTAKEEHKQHATVCNKSTKCNKKIKIKCLLKCIICDSSFSTPIEYRLHQKGHDKQNELFQCSLCSRKFKRKSTLYNHIKKHEKSNEIKHTCEICKREFKYKAYLENHILTAHSRSDGFACDVCAKHFSSQEGLDIHKESHKKEKKHQCTMCSKSFLMLCTLKEHLRTHTGEKPFLCSQCGRGFSQKNNLAQHMRRHQGLKAFKCESCEKRFVSKGELEAHSRKHSGAHPFVCDDCGSGFTTSSALVKHRRIHTGERPYHCDLCPMRFAASGTLKNHRRTHTGERPFQCSYCEKAFVQRNDLISHIRCHTGERPYICTQCGQSFRKASGLKTHVKMHKESMPPPTSHSMGVVLGMHLNGQ